MLKILVNLNRSTALRVQTGVVVLTLFLGWVVICSEGSAVNAVTISESLKKELTLTQEEKIVFDKFKLAVHKNLTLDYLKHDLFLLRWIRGKDLDVNRAKRDMLMYLDFIEKNRLATIQEEDWSDLLEDYPFTTNITDRQGRPVGYVSIGGSNWNIRRGFLQGKRSRLIRYSYMMFLQLNTRLFDIMRRHPNVTRFNIMMDLDGFNPVNQVCTACMSVYINLLDSYERFFPGFTHEIIVINAPQSYLAVVDVLRPFLSKNTRGALKVFGPNRNKWLPYVDARIDTKKFNEFLE